MLVLFAIIIVVALIIQDYSVRNARNHDKIRYDCAPSVRSCEPGEEFLVFSVFSNLGLKPTPIVRIEERFPKELEVLEAEQFNVKVLTDDYRIFRSTVLARSHQQVKRYLRASIAQRGEYRFSYADFRAGDFLGFKEFEYRMHNDHSIVIYPARIENADYLKTFENAMDELALRRQLLEDPISVCGFRDYTGREPMRQISWKHTAMHNSLIVKQFDPVWQPSVCIALDMHYHGGYDMYFKRQELCFSIARTCCEYLEEKAIGYRLVTNAIITNEVSSFTSIGGKGGAFQSILYALGSAKNGGVCTVDELMTAVCSASYKQDMIVYISTCRNKEVRHALERVRALSGAKVLTVFAEDIMPTDGSETAEGGGAA